MSWVTPHYPPRRYDRDDGEISASFRPAEREPELRFAGGGSMHYLATRTGTDGDVGLYRVTMGPGRSGTGTHFHRTMSEAFFVLSGALRFFDGRRWVDGGPGDYLHVPPGGLHAFWNESGAEVSFLMLFAPGADREGYFEGLPQLAEMSATERAEFFVQHDSIFTDVADGPAGDVLDQDRPT